MVEFTKYHKIPAANKHALPAGSLVVQHKLDGANAGIERQDGALVIHSRNTALARITFGPEGEVNPPEMLARAEGFGGLVDLVKASAEEIYDFMWDNSLGHIYGEWLIQHKIKYPEGMYRKFYVCDLVTDRGIYVDPEQFMSAAIHTFGFVLPRSATLIATQATHAMVREVTLLLQEQEGYAIEGAVVKSYALDAEGAVDRFGNRFVYKDVLPEYQESKGVPKPASPAEQQLAEAMPTRAIEKRYLDVVAANGGQFEGKLIPQIIGRVWADFLGEYLGGALKDLKHPVVNTNELKRLMDTRARTFALEYSSEVAA